MSGADVHRGPSAAAWRAVNTALEKFIGLGRYASFGGFKDLQRFEVRWDDPQMPHNAAGETRFYSDGSIVVCLRSDMSLDEIEKTTLHECQHVADHDLMLLP